MKAGSFPPSSIQVGIITSAAAEATFFPTGSLPMTNYKHMYILTSEILTGDMPDEFILGHPLRKVWETDDKLYNVLIHPTSTKTGFDTTDIPC
jgi:hypothetical protein